jgi:hypothetical protein
MQTEPISPRPKRLLTRKQLLRELDDAITSKKFSELRRKRLIPEIDLGHRTKRYELEAVLRALQKLTVREVD